MATVDEIRSEISNLEAAMADAKRRLFRAEMERANLSIGDTIRVKRDGAAFDAMVTGWSRGCPLAVRMTKSGTPTSATAGKIIEWEKI